MKRLNKEDVFIYDITPEEEEKYIQNTEKNIARREGLAEGLAEGRAEGHEAGLAEGQKVDNRSFKRGSRKNKQKITNVCIFVDNYFNMRYN